MEIISVILSGWLIFGLQMDEIPLPKDEVVYKILPSPVNEIAWPANTDKWHKLTHIALTELETGYTEAKSVVSSSDTKETLSDGSIKKMPIERIYSIFFPIEKAVPIPALYETFIKNIPVGSTVSIFGYASPDGKNPEQQYDLAKARASYISQAIKAKNVIVSSEGARVCGLTDYKPSCWRVDVKLLEETHEITIGE